MERRRAGEGREEMTSEEQEEKECREYILEKSCSLCGEIWECDGPDNPEPGGVCEIDDGEFDDDEGEYE